MDLMYNGIFYKEHFDVSFTTAVLKTRPKPETLQQIQSITRYEIKTTT